MKQGLIALAALACMSGTASAQQFTGDWQGQMEQEGGRPYPIAVSFAADGAGRVDYSQQACSGALEPIATHAGYAFFHETIDVNRYDPAKNNTTGCIDGMVTFTMVGDVLYLSWVGVSEGLVVRSQAWLDRR